VTTQRLIVSSVKGGKPIVSIPFGQIVRISRLVRKPWMTLAIGLGLTTVGFVFEMRFSVQATSVINAMVGTSNLGASILRIGLPLAPTIAAVAMFYRRTKDGFVVHYGTAQKIFLTREFGMALRTVHSLVRGIQGTMDEPDSV